MDEFAGQLHGVETIRKFAFSGKARLTLQSARTNTCYTYRLDTKDGKPTFVSVLTGSDNELDYRFLGSIFNRDRYAHSRKSTIAETAGSAIAFKWFAQKVLICGHEPSELLVWHEGRCGRCGRTLTVPSSIESGLGPECAGKV